MSCSNHGNSDPTSENVEQEDEVKVEEASVNLDGVKRELDEEELEFEYKQYKLALTLENVFGESSTLQQSNQDSLIGFLDGDVIMETESIKLEDVKEENKDLTQKTIEQSNCNKCGGNYQGYCPNCSSLSHILNITPNLNTKPVLNTTPLNMFEIREVSRGCAVFALKTLPKDIILGPFEGIAPIESTTGLQWKIRDRKLVNDQNGNWMKYIESVAKPSSRNLDVFQFNGILYFETSREIQEGEELLVCYREEKEEVLKSDKEEVFYLVPLKKEEYPKVFACTLCCLGFRLESCLVEHKSKCPYGVNFEDFKIIQCHCCKVWLEKEEYLASHILHCLENYNRLCRNRISPDFAPTTTDNEEQVHENEEITTSIDVNASYTTLPTETIDSKNFIFQTEVHKEEYFHHRNMETTHSNTNNLKSHLGTQYDICKQRFNQRSSLNLHIKNKHSTTNEKEYKCSACSYQTNRKSNLKIHLGTHTGIKHFQCDICKQRFGLKGNLKRHIKNKHRQGNLKIHVGIHSNTNEMEYKCSECSYQTNRKGDLKVHLDTHSDIKHFQCDICKQRFGYKRNLNVHIKNKHSNSNEKEYTCFECSYQTNWKGDLKKHLGIHSNTSEKEYKCSQCSFQTNYRSSLKIHLGTHTDIKNFQCDTCKQGFTQKSNLQRHIKNKHSNPNEKEYKCSECSYQTNWKCSFKNHMGSVHSNTNEKEYKCSECSYQTNWKCDLKKHLGIHSNTSEKEYKCSECPFQTNYRSSLKIHLGTHTNVKNFQCDICKQGFTQKSNLQAHIKNKHSNTNEKEYKCSECSYQTNRKGHLKVHLDTHSKHFQCDICKQRFGHKGNLKLHIKNKHSNTNEKEFKCSACSYQTNHKGSLNRHLGTH